MGIQFERRRHVVLIYFPSFSSAAGFQSKDIPDEFKKEYFLVKNSGSNIRGGSGGYKYYRVLQRKVDQSKKKNS